MGSEAIITLISILALQTAEPSRLVMPTGGLPVARYVAPPNAVPVKKDSGRLGVEVTAKAAVVIDAKTGHVLFEKDANRSYPLASLTKLMSAMVLLDQKPDMNQVIELSEHDRGRIGRTFIELQDSFTRQELLEIMLVASANEAAASLARTSLGTEAFVKAMNAKARELGLSSAIFFDTSGLDPRNSATARDVALTMRAALNYPAIQSIATKSTLTVRGRSTSRLYTLKSTNLLLGSALNRDPYRVIAGKTGSLDEAGFCFAQVTRNQAGNEVISVVLGSESHFARFQDVKSMTYWAYDAFTWPASAARR